MKVSRKPERSGKEMGYGEMPHLMLGESLVPEIRDWEVGKTYKFEIEAEQMLKEKGGWMTENQNEIVGRFKVVKIKAKRDDERTETLKEKYRL
jgi:hypothetical protein